jgi:hypothetical protein
MSIYNDFLNKLDRPELIDVSNVLRDEITAFTHIELKKKYNLPFFYGKTWICYFNLIKKKEIELCFVRGRELPSKELLNFKERVMIGGLSFKTIEEIDFGILKLLLEEAVTLDQEKPYTFVKKKK